MAGFSTEIARKKRIDHVIDHILANLTSEISLETLAGVANYSPFHLQKTFKEIVGESPKQYIIKLRLETAFHLIVIHPQKSIQEISLDCGFSSHAVFTRAIKNYFGHSPEQLRNLPHKARMKIFHALSPGRAAGLERESGSMRESGLTREPGKTQSTDIPAPTPVRIIKKEPVKGVYLIAPSDDPLEIQRSFKALSAIAGVRDRGTTGSESKMYGILSPHQRNIYRAFIPYNKEVSGTNDLHITEIKGGKFASFKVRGDLKQTYRAAHYFYRQWLPDNGYKIAGVTGFETFSGDPASTSYLQLEREIHIPIEPLF